MDWILLSALGSAALLLTELYDFVCDSWPHRRPRARNESVLTAPSAYPAAAPQTMSPPTIRAVTKAVDSGIDGGGWQTTARRLAGEWTVMDGVTFHHEAQIHGAGAASEIAMRRTLSPDQILSARINAAYAVWAAARSSQDYGE